MDKRDLGETKVSEKMETLKAKVFDEIKNDILARGEDLPTEEELNQKVMVKYLGKMEFLNEQGELAEKDVFIVTEDLGGMFQNLYYDGDLKLLGVQQMIGKEIYPTEYMLGKIPEEMKELTEQDIEEANTIEEQKEEEAKEEPQQLPGLEGPQLTREAVESMDGPKVFLNEENNIDGQTLGNVIGLEGVYMKMVSADAIRRLGIDIEIPVSQQVVPIEIYSDGSANVIGEDKLQFSQIEGANSTEQHVTTTNEGTVRSEQNIETFNIASTGGMHTIAVGYNENCAPLEVKYGRRDIEDPNKIAYTELETVHEGPLQQDDKTREVQKSQDGIYKGQETIEDAVEIYAKAMNIKKIDEFGYQTSEYDLVAAREQLEARWSENPDLTLEELIDAGQKQRGPEGPKNHH